MGNATRLTWVKAASAMLLIRSKQQTPENRNERQPMNWEQPYSATRSPVCAENMVASSQPLAVQAGIDALRRGGNAVDAALSTAITLTVVEPNNNGLGSDAFALIWDGTELAGLNASGRAPRGWTAQRFAHRDKMPTLGWDSVTVPGAVSAWVELSARYGRLPFSQLFDAAIGYAEDGFLVGPKTAVYWKLAEQTFAKFADFGEHFFPAPDAGKRFRRPDLARTLKLIADSNGQDFYHGSLAERIIKASADAGGALDSSDLAEHQADWVTPIAQPYRDVKLHEIPPNGQGLAAQIALGILNHLPVPEFESTDSVHLQLEIMKVACRAAADHFADPQAMRVTPEQLLEPGSLAKIARAIGPKASALPPLALPISHDTVYLCAADREGMMVSFIQSNFMGFGSGIVIPGTGIAMQNRGCGFSLDPAHANCVAPGKRPFHTIIPGFVSDAGGGRLAFGVMGGHMQHQGHFQMVQRIFDHAQNPQAASDAPRWYLAPDYSVSLESGFSTSVAKDLAARGHRVSFEEHEHVFGGAQLIYRDDGAGGYVGGSDHRKEGMVAGF
jgi:gamma-glutamyltranspeptidase/glutathione hydrolase